MPAAKPCVALLAHLGGEAVPAIVSTQPIPYRQYQLAERELRVAENSQVGGKGLVQIPRVVGQVNDLLVRRQYRRGDAVAGKAAADPQDQVGFVQEVAAMAGEGTATRTQGQCVIFG